MREQEKDSYDANDPGVTIPFISLNISRFLTYLGQDTNTHENLYNELTAIIGPEDAEHNDILVEYFIDPMSDGAYLIAELYVNLVAQCGQNGIISFPNPYLKVLQDLESTQAALQDPYLSADVYMSLQGSLTQLKRLPNAIQEYNSESSHQIYFPDSEQIKVQNPKSLTREEQYIILASHTANVNYNSFAAEVVAHAQFMKWVMADLNSGFHRRAVRADMAVGEEFESGSFDVYYDLDSLIVKTQERLHGKR